MLFIYLILIGMFSFLFGSKKTGITEERAYSLLQRIFSANYDELNLTHTSTEIESEELITYLNEKKQNNLDAYFFMGQKANTKKGGPPVAIIYMPTLLSKIDAVMFYSRAENKWFISSVGFKKYIEDRKKWKPKTIDKMYPMIIQGLNEHIPQYLQNFFWHTGIHKLDKFTLITSPKLISALASLLDNMKPVLNIQYEEEMIDDMDGIIFKYHIADIPGLFERYHKSLTISGTEYTIVYGVCQCNMVDWNLVQHPCNLHHQMFYIGPKKRLNELRPFTTDNRGFLVAAVPVSPLKSTPISVRNNSMYNTRLERREPFTSIPVVSASGIYPDPVTASYESNNDPELTEALRLSLKADSPSSSPLFRATSTPSPPPFRANSTSPPPLFRANSPPPRLGATSPFTNEDDDQFNAIATTMKEVGAVPKDATIALSLPPVHPHSKGRHPNNSIHLDLTAYLGNEMSRAEAIGRRELGDELLVVLGKDSVENFLRDQKRIDNAVALLMRGANANSALRRALIKPNSIKPNGKPNTTYDDITRKLEGLTVAAEATYNAEINAERKKGNIRSSGLSVASGPPSRIIRPPTQLPLPETSREVVRLNPVSQQSSTWTGFSLYPPNLRPTPPNAPKESASALTLPTLKPVSEEVTSAANPMQSRQSRFKKSPGEEKPFRFAKTSAAVDPHLASLSAFSSVHPRPKLKSLNSSLLPEGIGAQSTGTSASQAALSSKALKSLVSGFGTTQVRNPLQSTAKKSTGGGRRPKKTRKRKTRFNSR